MSGHELYEELAAGHAVHALEPQDEELFRRHLVGCARCERELDVHRETAAHLAYGAGDDALPDDLFDRIRRQVVALSGDDVFAAHVEPPARPVADLVAARRRRTLPRSAVLVSAAAAVSLVLGLVGPGVALRQDRADQLASSDRLADAVRTLEEGPGRSVPLLDGQRRVAAVAVVQGDEVSLAVEGLAANALDSTYVLWEQSRSSGLTAIGTFDVRDEGVEVVEDLPLAHDRKDVTAFAITHERGRMAPSRPLTAPLASGAVEQA